MPLWVQVWICIVGALGVIGFFCCLATGGEGEIGRGIGYLASRDDGDDSW